MNIFTRILVIVSLLLINSSLLLSQRINCQIKDVIKDSTFGETLFGASVWLENYGLESTINNDCEYRINQIPPGSYTNLIVRCIDYQQKELAVEILIFNFIS